VIFEGYLYIRQLHAWVYKIAFFVITACNNNLKLTMRYIHAGCKNPIVIIIISNINIKQLTPIHFLIVPLKPSLRLFNAKCNLKYDIWGLLKYMLIMYCLINEQECFIRFPLANLFARIFCIMSSRLELIRFLINSF
jgi:hypothetical protein